MERRTARPSDPAAIYRSLIESNKAQGARARPFSTPASAETPAALPSPAILLSQRAPNSMIEERSRPESSRTRATTTDVGISKDGDRNMTARCAAKERRQTRLFSQHDARRWGQRCADCSPSSLDQRQLGAFRPAPRRGSHLTPRQVHLLHHHAHQPVVLAQRASASR